MANKFRYALPILAAFLFMGLSIAANADKPPKEEELITLYAGPLLSQQMQLSYTNHSDRTLDVNLQFYVRWAYDGISVPDRPFSPKIFSLPPHSSAHYSASFGVDPDDRHFARVEVSYIGFRNEVRGTFCAVSFDPSAQLAGCVPLED